MKAVRLKGIKQFEIEEIPELSKPVSIVNLVKYAKQSYYNGNTDYYELPSSKLEEGFVLTYVKNSTQENSENLLKSYVDSTGQYARVTTFMKDIGTDKMAKIEDRLQEKINKLLFYDLYFCNICLEANKSMRLIECREILQK